ncbi:MAG: EamA family transporter [Hydrogenophaga sp.]|uniref:DMT family transporter n=1 Tax=Hydrogenophaga sp. TaxID=1904254 RepID=UPI0016A183C5|nr:DMT family transporter [Hydrogenophaga sp.]NIM42449.1 EamA family transporter [Hydrogenophaga sp.]NIN27600.1 EamA family transporter [Hydrogenophaga sp.]NIN32420.1 EamA family transporter [Hydrogenophaga sp.]NIN56871.1 EamA family transporter [Hydrogenophaga sp.]NIO53016.1 EamA family transporter [Hydrogenophaga sp.]
MTALIAPAPARTLAGIALLVSATACFAVLDTTVKAVGAVVSVLLVIWFRYLFHAVAMTTWLLPRRGRAALRTGHPRFQLLRGALLLSLSLMGFLALQQMPVGEFTAILMFTPLAVTLMGATLLRERVSTVQWLLVAGGFVGVLLVVRPDGGDIGWASALPLAMVFISAWFQILTARMARTEDPLTMHLYTGWVGALVTSALLPFVWQAIPDTRTLALLVLVGVMGTLGHLLLILAYQRAPASTLSPYLYTQIAFAMAFGWLAFGHVPGAIELLGVALIVLCGAVSGWRTTRSRLPVSPPED